MMRNLLMIIIISSFNDAIAEGKTENKWNSSINSLLLQDLNIHINTYIIGQCGTRKIVRTVML